MSTYLFTPDAIPSIPVKTTDDHAPHYPVSRIFCVGRNYAAHAREMGADPTREPPFYFMKPANALTLTKSSVPYAAATKNFHYEMELVVAIGAPIFKGEATTALSAVWGYACGLDMTRRDLQNKAKEKGHPWDVGKGFEHSAIISPLIPAAECPHLHHAMRDKGATITLSLNGVQRQHGHTTDMIWTIPEIVANLSQYYHLKPGDIIYTGTPEGVGPVRVGDSLIGHIEGVGSIELHIDDQE